MKTSTSPKHIEPTSIAKRVAIIVLVSGTILAAAAAFGTIWFVRAGVGISVIAGLTAAGLLIKEIAAVIANSRAEAKQMRNRYDSQMLAERQRERDVLDSIDQRIMDLNATIRDLRDQLAHAKSQLEVTETALVQKTVKAQSQEELLQARNMNVEDLRRRIQDLEAEVLYLQLAIAQPDAELLTLPMRFGAEKKIKQA